MAMPEEINRLVADRLSRLLFAPTKGAADRLVAEGVDPSSVFQVGDVMLDALRWTSVHLPDPQTAAAHDLQRGAYALATIHRAENVDDPGTLAHIVAALEALAGRMPVAIVLHPRTSRRMADAGLAFGAVRVLPPLGYAAMASLQASAAVIVTDSGGVQKEAFFHRVPCVTLRGETEWPETVEAGWNRLCAPDAASLLAAVDRAIETPGADMSPFGDGRAADAIAAVLADFLGGSRPGAARPDRP